MIRTRSMIVLAFSVFSALYLSAQTRSVDDYLQTVAGQASDILIKGGVKVAAIPEFTDISGKVGGRAGALGKYIAWSFSGILTEASSGKFKVVDRQDTARILAEQEFQFSGPASEEGRVAIGSILSADSLLFGLLDPEESSVAVTVRVVNAETGAILGKVSRTIPVSQDEDAQALLGRETRDQSMIAEVSPSRDEPYSITVRANGKAKPNFQGPDGTYVLARPNESYEIEIGNNSDRTVGVALYIDGINTVFMKRELPSKGVKWVLGPNSSAMIPGWQADMGTARKFLFTGKDESLAAKTGYTEEIGIISASFFPERKDASRGPQEAGTAAGEAFDRAVKTVQVRLEKEPARVLVLRYDYASGLRARGIRYSE